MGVEIFTVKQAKNLQLRTWTPRCEDLRAKRPRDPEAKIADSAVGDGPLDVPAEADGVPAAADIDDDQLSLAIPDEN